MSVETKPPWQVGVTPEEYLVREARAEYKSDYLYGEIRAMSGVSASHGSITINLIVAVGTQLLGRSCQAFSNDVKIAVDPKGMYVYSHLTVVCDEPVFMDKKKYLIANPTVIFEILSPSTEEYDRNLKSLRYRQIPSLRQCVLISQYEPRVEVYTRQHDDIWLMTTVEGLQGTVALDSIGCSVPMERLYDRVPHE